MRGCAVADPDLELRGGGGWGGLDLLAMVAIFPSVISSFFTQNKGGGPGLSPRSATAMGWQANSHHLLGYKLTYRNGRQSAD